MTIRSFFPTRIEVAPLKKKGIAAFNRDLIDVCDSLRLADKTGQRWSARHYPGGYTSYGSHDQMHRIRSEEHTSELQSLMRISYAVFCLKKQQRPQFNKYNTPPTHTYQVKTHPLHHTHN